MRAVAAAAEAGGMDPRDIDGFVSWGSEGNVGTFMIGTLGTKELRYNAVVWSYGGGSSGAIGTRVRGVEPGQDLDQRGLSGAVLSQ